MIFRKIWPTEGGALRRWTTIRKELFDRNMEKEKLRNAPLTLFDFTRQSDAADAEVAAHGPQKGGWRVSDDEVIGGYSTSHMKLIRSVEDYRRHMKFEPYVLEPKEEKTEQDEELQTDDDTENRQFQPGDESPSVLDDIKKKNSKFQVQKSDSFIPFIRWSGNLDTRVGENSKATRSGFAAIRSPEFPFGINLKSSYNALEVTCRSDGRTYTVTMKISSYFPDDLYQGIIAVEPTHPHGSSICQMTGGAFVTMVLPFKSFVLTSQGRMREVQRELDGAINIEHVGLTLMDGENGDFEFDLARVRAVNYVDGYVLSDGDDEEEEVGQERTER